MNFRCESIRFSCLVTVSLAAGLAPSLAHAGKVLVIRPPAGHTVEPDTPDPGYTEAYAVNSKLDADAGCGFAFQPVAATGASQAQLNAIAATPAYMTTVKSFLGLKFDIERVEPYRMEGVVGVRAEGDGKGGAGVRTLATILETPKGRTNVVCIGPSARFGTLRPEFEAITRGVVLPR